MTAPSVQTLAVIEVVEKFSPKLPVLTIRKSHYRDRIMPTVHIKLDYKVWGDFQITTGYQNSQSREDDVEDFHAFRTAVTRALLKIPYVETVYVTYEPAKPSIQVTYWFREPRWRV